MKPSFQLKQQIIVNVSLEKVWAFNQDLTNIADFHPRINQVELLSGHSLREAGVYYKCYLEGGKYSCIEKDILILPLEKVVTVTLETSDGIRKLFSDYSVESYFTRITPVKTKVEYFYYYSAKTIKAKLVNLLLKRALTRASWQTHLAMKEMIETLAGKF